MRLDKRKFERWLKSKRADEIVGHNRDCHSCPIALFYQSRGVQPDIFLSDRPNGAARRQVLLSFSRRIGEISVIRSLVLTLYLRAKNLQQCK
jgi:hypothetical protein